MTNFARQMLVRGERGVAGLGIATAMILMVCVAANSYFADRASRDAMAESNLSQLNATGPLLAEAAGRLIASNQLSALRRLANSTAMSLRLSDCRISLGEDRVVSDISPARITVRDVPEHWTVGTIDQSTATPDATTRLRFPFSISGRGAGFVEIAASPIEAKEFSSSGMSAVICAGGLAVLVLVYHRSRRSLAEVDVIRGALTAISNGETAIEALQVDARLGATATTWNKLLGEIDDLRRRGKASAAVPASGSRRAGGNNLEAACDAMSQGLILVDDKMRVRFSNGAACTFFNRDRATLSGMAAIELVADTKYRDALLAIAEGNLRRPVTVELEQSAETGGGLLRVCIRPVRRGDSDSAMIIIEDITQQRAAEGARSTFINHVAHELRTPLTNIRLYTETAIEDGQDNAEVRANCLNVINQESRRLERIVSEMLSVAEIEAGSTRIRSEEVYFDVLVNDLKNDYVAQAADKKIELVFNVAPKLPKLTADKDKLAIAMHNLIGNALKYTTSGGKVTVNVDVRDGALAIDVVDTGIGITADEADKIFDRYFRSADPRVGKIVGTGLGLTLAREVMRLHGGDITVQSEINRGSTFTATLPVSEAA